MRAILAAAALAALAVGPAAAEPRIVALSDADAAAYRDAFAAADRGDAQSVRRVLNGVEDDVLLGTALGRAYMSADRRSYSQVSAWLGRYGELAIADDVYRQAQRIRPRRARRAPTPERTRTRPSMYAPSPPAGDSARVRADISALQERVSMGGDVAAMADRALSGPRSGQAAWLMGLVAFRARDYAGAARYFEQSAAWPHHDRAASAASHFWAARSYLARGETAPVLPHLEAAARVPTKFYGQLAESRLGRESALDFTPPSIPGAALRDFIEAHPEARRAAALAQIGRLSEVEDELRRLHGRIDPRDDLRFLALAQALAAPSAQLRAADYGTNELASGYCPATTFEPNGGFTLDRALLYAIVRQESYYNPVAVSVSNARGLMQLLPSTAHDMDRTRNYRRNPAALFDPNENMRLGQQYVIWLMNEFHSDGDLARVFAAYNGGPGWLQRWLNSVGDIQDPLLLLELLPRAESRDYAERVLSHMAMCRRSFGQPTPELDALASGRPAIYRPLDRNHPPVLAAQP
ncbi:MAG: transglycosylase SLT domain-containing protein [Alphaproteobacteria bacterium]|nr:transglycosylase SLT domain-containing protein [Alphaproteobacteria bacterium]